MATAASGVQLALIAALAIVVIYLVIVYGRKYWHEGFASKRAREVYREAREVFAEGGGDANYTRYKNKVKDADPVQYSDVRKLHQAGRLTPETVDRVL